MTPEDNAALILRNVRYLLLATVALMLVEGVMSTSSGWDMVQGMALLVALRFVESALGFLPRVTSSTGFPTRSFFQLDPRPSDERSGDRAP